MSDDIKSHTYWNSEHGKGMKNRMFEIMKDVPVMTEAEFRGQFVQEFKLSDEEIEISKLSNQEIKDQIRFYSRFGGDGYLERIGYLSAERRRREQ